MSMMNRLRTLALAAPAVALVSLAAATNAQSFRGVGAEGSVLQVPGVTPRAVEAPSTSSTRGPGGIPAPEGYQGTAANFGGIVELDGDRLAIASATDVLIYNITLGAYETTGLFTLPGVTVNQIAIVDVALEGDIVGVAYEAMGAGNKYAYGLWKHDGTNWVLYDEIFGFSSSAPELEIHAGIVYVGISFVEWRLISFDPSGPILVQLDASVSKPGATCVAMSVGDGPTIAITTEDNVTGDRSVRAFGTHLIEIGVVATGSNVNDFAGQLAVADRFYWLGSPLADPGAVDGGMVSLYYEPSAGYFIFGGATWSAQAGDHWGRGLSFEGDTLAFSERHADLLFAHPGAGIDVGAVRLHRYNGAGGWNFHNEIIHSFDQDYTNPDGFGASIALDGLTMVVGEPDGAGFVSIYNLPATSHHTDNVSPNLAGFNGVAPIGSHFGLAFDGFPNAVEILNARPLATAFLVIGVSNLSANFKGGVLFPSPDFIQALPLDGSGSLLLPYFWSAPPGDFTIYAQYWVADVDGPVGFSATGGFTVRQDF